MDRLKPLLDDQRREYNFQLCARCADSLVENGMISQDECRAMKHKFEEIFCPEISGFLFNKA